MIVIPSRLASKRFPNKPLYLIDGEPMIVKVWRQAMKTGFEVVVAAADREIVDVIEDVGGKAILTGEHPSGTDRVAEIANGPWIINLQGDQPWVEPETIRMSLDAMRGNDIGTVVTPMGDPSNEDVTKVVFSRKVHYFSRSPVPFGGPYYRHLGIYAFQREALQRFASHPPTVLERTERLEQLRALDIGLSIGVSVVASAPPAVDRC